MAQLKQLCYSCSNVAILSISVGGLFKEVCGSCYTLWSMQGHPAPGHKQNRVKGASMLCYDNCGRPAAVVMPQPTVGPHARMQFGATPITKDVAVCSECADVRRLENLEATNPSHHPQGSRAEAMLERLAGDKDDFSDIPGPGNLSQPTPFLCPWCSIVMVLSPSTLNLVCSQCHVQVFFTP